MPRIGTPRDESSPTRGPLLYALDDIVGFPLIPWQRHTADIALEITSDGRWRYRTVCLVVARQNGKTSMLTRRILAALLAPNDPRDHVMHTAQDRQLPRVVFEDVADVLMSHPQLAAATERIRWSNGSEEIVMQSGVTYRIVAPNADTVRGWSVGLLIIDEARAQRDMAVVSAAQYAMRARPNPQLWLVSNAGDPDSVVLNQLRDRGRDQDPTLCYLEWSAHPDREIDDVRGWCEANPALGHFIRGDAILDEMRTDEPNRFRTESLCQWVDVTTSHAIDFADWTRCADRDLPTVDTDTDEPVWAALDIDGDRRSAALVAGVWSGDRLAVDIVQHWTDSPAEADIADTVAAFADRYRPQAIGYDPNTCGGVVNRLGDVPIEWARVTGAQWVVACGQLDDAVRTQTLTHRDDPELTRQVSAAGRRDIGDGTWRMSRLDSDIPIPAAIALARLVYVAVRPGSPVGITVL